MVAYRAVYRLAGRAAYSAPLFSRLFPELPRPVYQQESFWALTLDQYLAFLRYLSQYQSSLL